jgi:hypothetical protein
MKPYLILKKTTYRYFISAPYVAEVDPQLNMLRLQFLIVFVPLAIEKLKVEILVL